MMYSLKCAHSGCIMLHQPRSHAPAVRALGVPPHPCRNGLRSKAATDTTYKGKTCNASAEPMPTAGGVESETNPRAGSKQPKLDYQTIDQSVDVSIEGALREAQWLCKGCEPRPEVMVTQEWESARIQLQQIVAEVEGKRGRCVSDDQQGVKCVAIQCGEWLQQGQPGYEKMPDKLAALKPTGPARGIIRAYGVGGGHKQEHQRECMVLPLGEDGYPVADGETGAALLMSSAEFKACTTKIAVHNCIECFLVAHKGKPKIPLQTFFKYTYGFPRVTTEMLKRQAAEAARTTSSNSSSSSSSNISSNGRGLGNSSAAGSTSLPSEGAKSVNFSLLAAAAVADPATAALGLSEVVQEAYACIIDNIELTNSMIADIDASILEVQSACMAGLTSDGAGANRDEAEQALWDQLHELRERKWQLREKIIMREQQLVKLQQLQQLLQKRMV